MHTDYGKDKMTEEFREDWIKPVNENILWICQLPRSGGTLLLRLLDSHPEIHCYPAVFGFLNEGRIWPSESEITHSADILEEIFSYMNMEKFHLIGLKKKSSNMKQDRYPVYFNNIWFKDMYKLVLKGESPREHFNAFFTALFNAWRNNQNLYGIKKYIVGQMTMHKPELYQQNYINYKAIYPEGKMVFILRNIEDWLASSVSLKESTPFSEDPTNVMDYYKTIMRQAVTMAENNQLIVFRFEDMVLEPRQVLTRLSEWVGIKWNESLLDPTFNGAPFFQNSSFQVDRKSNIDPSVVGRGNLLDKSILNVIDEEARELYSRMQSHIIYKKN